MEFTNAVTIGRSTHDVFEYLADFENVPKWNDAIVETSKTSPGPVGVGTTYRQIRSIPSRSEELLEVIEFEPDKRLAIRGRIGPFEGTLTYVLEPEHSGTRLLNAASLEGRGLMKVAAPIAAGRVRDAVAENLAKLRDLLESERTRG